MADTPAHTPFDDRMEASVSGSTGSQAGLGVGSRTTRMVSSKFMASAAAAGSAPLTQRGEAAGRQAFRAGASMSVAATPAQVLQSGRSLNFPPSVRAPGTAAATPSGGASTILSATSAAGLYNVSAAMNAAAQESRRELLAKFKQEKASRQTGSAGSTGPPSAGAMGPPPPAAAAGPRVPPLALGALRDTGANPQADGSKSSRVTGGPTSARQPATGRAAAGHGAAAGGAYGSYGRSYAAAQTARAPPVPRAAAAAPGAARAEQVLHAAVAAPLPVEDVWEAAQIPLPAEAQDDALALATPQTPSSRITRSPLRGAMVGGAAAAGLWAPGNQPSIRTQPQAPQPPPVQQPPPPAHAPYAQSHPAAAPARSPQPLSARSAQPSAGAPAHQGGFALDGSQTARTWSNAEASTSDTGGRSVRDQIKFARLQELQWRCLKVKLDAAARARVDKGQRQLAACALLLTDMVAQASANSSLLAGVEAARRTQRVVAAQLPLLEQWRDVQGPYGQATREVLAALQNAMTSLPLVNGAALGAGGGDGAAALPDLRRALAASLAALQSAEAALGALLAGSAGRLPAAARLGGAAEPEAAGGSAGAGAGAAGQAQGGAPQMAALLPRLRDTLVGEVAALRHLFTHLEALAAKHDETASLRATLAAAAADAHAAALPADDWGGAGAAAWGGVGMGGLLGTAASMAGSGAAVW